MRSTILAVVLTTLAAPSAQAAWSPAVTIPRSTGAERSAVAVNARGDAAVIWSTDAAGRTAVRVAVRHGRTGRFATTTLLGPAAQAVSGATVTIDGRGDATVAWAQRASDRGALHGPVMLRTAFASAGGWSKVRTLARISPFAYAFPRLAAAPDRRVLLTFNAGNRQAPGLAAAWRRPGHDFGRVQDLHTGRGAGGYFFDAQTQFDRAGRAYASGTRRCDLGTSAGMLLTAAPGAVRFTAAGTVAPAPARDVHLALTGSGRGALVWLAVSCSTTELLPGPVHAASVRHGTAGPPTVLADRSRDLGLVAGPGGTAEARWVSILSPDAVQAARSDASGAFGSPFVPAGNLVPVVADARGDQLVGTGDPAWLNVGGQPTDLRARTPDGTLTPPPVPTGRAGSAAAVTPAGRGLAVAVTTRGGVRFASWTP